MTERQWATESETSKHARVSGNTLRRWRAQGLITGYKVGRTVRYDLAEIDAMIAARSSCHDESMPPQHICPECGTYNPDEEVERSAAHQDA